MRIYVALLRAVNLAGRNRVGMASLREFVTELGMRNVRSLLQSGNLVFESGLRSPARVETLLESAAAARPGFGTEFFVRSADEWMDLVDRNPFPDQAGRRPQHLLVAFLKQAPGPDRIARLREAVPGPEVVHVLGRQVYIVYPDGIGRSRLTTARLERALGTSSTGRNWNTVLGLQALLRG